VTSSLQVALPGSPGSASHLARLSLGPQGPLLDKLLRGTGQPPATSTLSSFPVAKVTPKVTGCGGAGDFSEGAASQAHGG
jgi:hypothetical protein